MALSLRRQFGIQLKATRLERELTQEQFAELVGISVDFLSLIGIRRFDAGVEPLILIDVALADALVLPLGEFVIPQEKMDTGGKLAFEGGDEIEKLVRFVAALGILKRPVHHFLQHEMPLRLFGEVGDFEREAKILDVAV